MTPKSVVIEGRRWFDKTYGNTYNTVEIWVDSEVVAVLPMEYGYDEFYRQRAEKWLHDNHPAFTDMDEYTAIWRYCEDQGIHCHYYAIDGLKRDLHKG